VSKPLYDTANRRTRAFLEDGSAWVCGYNDRDELISARRYWGDWTPYSGQQFGFEYDNIGNRKKAWVGGDNQGANLREISYTAFCIALAGATGQATVDVGTSSANVLLAESAERTSRIHQSSERSLEGVRPYKQWLMSACVEAHFSWVFGSAAPGAEALATNQPSKVGADLS